MNVPEIIGWAVIGLVALVVATALGLALVGLFYFVVGKLGPHWQWTPLRHLLWIDEGNERQLQVMYLVPFGRWHGLCLMRQTRKAIDRSQPGDREHTSPTREDAE